MKIGVDVVDMERVARLSQKAAFLHKIFTVRELELIKDKHPKRRVEILSGRFAVKEAVVKALGTGFSANVGPRDIETLIDEAGRPNLVLLHGAAAKAAEQGLDDFLVSISHSQNTAIAFVVLSRVGHEGYEHKSLPTIGE